MSTEGTFPRGFWPSFAALRAAAEPPPGPAGRPLLGCLPELRRDPLGLLTRSARQHGSVSSFRVLGMPIYLFAAPEGVEAVLARRSASFAKGRGLRAGKKVFGNGLLTSEGEFWKRQRRLAAPAFHRERIAGYAASMTELAEARFASWAAGETRDVHAEMMSLTLAIVGKTLFSSDVSGEADAVGEALAVALEEFPPLLNPLRRFLADVVPTKRNLRLKHAVARLDEVVLGLVARRRGAPDNGDLLSMLREARDDDGAGMSDEQLRDETMTLFLAGHETTAVALSWAIDALARNPEADARLFAELEALGRPVSFADLPRLPYLDAVVKETMRLYPPAWAIGRQALEDVEVAGTLVPKGASVLVSPWVTHRDPALFADPLRFAPERWLEGAKTLPRFAYFPFGGGPRVCIGSSFAHAEAALLLAAAARRFRFRVAPDQRVERDGSAAILPSVTLRPRDGLRMVLEGRKT